MGDKRKGTPKRVEDLYLSLQQDELERVKTERLNQLTTEEMIVNANPIVYDGVKGIPTAVEVERAQLNIPESVNNLLNGGGKKEKLKIDEEITTRYLSWIGFNKDKITTHRLLENVVQIVNTDVKSIKFEFRTHVSMKNDWILAERDLLMYQKRINDILRSQSYGGFVFNDKVEYVLGNPYGVGRGLIKDKEVTMLNSMRIGLECYIKNGKLVTYIFDPVLWEMCKIANVNASLPWEKICSELIASKVNLSVVKQVLITVGSILFSSGSFFTPSFQIEMIPVIGTTFAFGGHTDALPTLSLQTVFDEKQSILTIGTWANILRCSVEATWKEEILGASYANITGHAQTKLHQTSVPGVSPFKLDGEEVLIDQKLIGVTNAELVVDQSICEENIYDLLRIYKGYIERDVENWTLHRKRIYKRPPLGAASKLDSILFENNINVAGAEVLDIGGAPGAWACYLDKLGAKVTTISDEGIIPYGDVYLNGVRDHVSLHPNIIKYDVNINDGIKFKQQFDYIFCDVGKEVQNESDQEGELLIEAYNTLDLTFKHIAEGGTCIMKMYTFELEETRDLINVLMASFKSVKIFKPYGSAITNSERYVVCQCFGEASNCNMKTIVDADRILVESQIFAIDEILRQYQTIPPLSQRKLRSMYKLNLLNPIQFENQKLGTAVFNYIRDWRYEFSGSLKRVPVKLSVTQSTHGDVFINIVPLTDDCLFKGYTRPILSGGRPIAINASVEWGIDNYVPYIILNGDMARIIKPKENLPLYIHFNETSTEHRSTTALAQKYSVINFWNDKDIARLLEHIDKNDGYQRVNIFYTALCTINVKKFFRGLTRSRDSDEIIIKNALSELITSRSIRPQYIGRDIILSLNRWKHKQIQPASRQVKFNEFISILIEKLNSRGSEASSFTLGDTVANQIMVELQQLSIILSKNFFKTAEEGHADEFTITHTKSGWRVKSKADANLFNSFERYFGQKVFLEFLSS